MTAPADPLLPRPAPALRARRWLACVVVPELPLQVLARRWPEVRERPAVVVAEDRPEGLILHANRKARAAGVLPGQRYAAGQALVAELRAGVVDARERQAAVDEVAALVRTCSPAVEPAADEPGVLWLDATGLRRLYGRPEPWADGLRTRLRAMGWYAAVAVGWERTALYAIARHWGGVRVARTRAQEAAWRDAVPLAVLGAGLGLDADSRDALHALGVATVGGLLQLPVEGLRERFGERAWQLHRALRGEAEPPLRPVVPVESPRAGCDLDPPDDNAECLLFAVRGLLHPLLAVVAVRREAVRSLVLRLHLEAPKRPPRPLDAAAPAPAPNPVVSERLQPADPTLQEALLVDLARIRLSTLQLPARAERVELEADTVRASAAQLKLWQLAGQRDPEAATAALARLRAAYGEDAVVHGQLRAAHLPEVQFRWLPLVAMPPPALAVAMAPATDVPRLVRRLLPRPVALPARPKHEPDGWLLTDWRQGSVVRMWGPFRVSGGWWVREVRRDYYYVETERGDLLFVYWDDVRRTWFLHGEVD
ncbi:MAG: DNA polymerase Y family protein [Myxococcales bacterium]|nr:DNA polymerase Y family protein [Myxococcales bacterium]